MDQNSNSNDLNNQNKRAKSDFALPYEDPAVTNPQELASFPKKSKIVGAKEIELESENHLVNNRTPVREGRNIIRTDNNPENDGFM